MDRKSKSILSSFSVLLLVAFLFVGWIGLAQFEANFRDIKNQYYSTVTSQVVQRLESAIHYGKKLDAFYGINRIFDEMKDLLQEDVKAHILGLNGEVLYTSYGEEVILLDTYEQLPLSITDKSGEIIGSFVLMYPKEIIENQIRQEAGMAVLQGSIILGGCLLLLVLTFVLGKGYKKLLFILPVCIAIGGIGVQSYVANSQYQEKYQQTMLEGAQGILNYVSGTIAQVHSQGVSYDKMNGLSEYLAGKVEESSILWRMSITDTLYSSDTVLGRESKMMLAKTLESNNNDDAVKLEIEISREYLDQKMQELVWIFLATMITVIVVIFEFMRLPEALTFRKEKHFNKKHNEQFRMVTQYLRIMTFLLYMSVYLSIGFSAMRVRAWGITYGGMDLELWASLPMTLELLVLMISSLGLSAKMKRQNLKKNLFLFATILIVGNVLCAFVNNPISLIGTRMICALGLAGIKIVINAIITYGVDTTETREAHIAQMNAGIIGGIMCGGALGAVVVNSIGLSNTYILSAAVVAILVGIVVVIIPWSLLQKLTNKAQSSNVQKDKFKLNHVWNKDVLLYIFLVALPVNIGIMFLVAFIPSFVESMTLPIIMISYAYLVNGIVGIYVAPFLTKLLLKKLGRKTALFITLLAGGLGHILLKVPPVLVMVLIASGVMGLVDGVGSPVSTNYFIDLKVVKEKIGTNMALTLQSILGNLIQMMAPMLYAICITNQAATISPLIVIGGLYLLASILFVLFGKTATYYPTTKGKEMGLS